MTEAQIKLFNEWLYEHPCQFSALGNVQAAWEHQQHRINELENKVESLSKLYISAVDQIVKQIEVK